jgi:hypothetical protein
MSLATLTDQLDEARGSLSAIHPDDDSRYVTIGRSPEVFRITELVQRGGFTGRRYVANGHSVTTRLPRLHIELHETQKAQAPA